MIQWKKHWNYHSHLYFSEKSDYSEDNTSDNENFRFTILQPFQIEPKHQKTYCNESQEEENKHIYVRLPVYYKLEYEISIGANLDITKTKREIVFVAERWCSASMLHRLDISAFYFYEPLLFQFFFPWKFIKT